MRMLKCHKNGHVYQCDDTKWIESQIDKLPYRMQNKVTERYSVIYSNLLINDPLNCRRRSNTWLRKTINNSKVTK